MTEEEIRKLLNAEPELVEKLASSVSHVKEQEQTAVNTDEARLGEPPVSAAKQSDSEQSLKASEQKTVQIDRTQKAKTPEQARLYADLAVFNDQSDVEDYDRPDVNQSDKVHHDSRPESAAEHTAHDSHGREGDNYGRESDSSHVRPERYIPTVGEEIRTLVMKIVYVLVAFFIVFTFIFGLHRNLSMGMQPSLRDGDLLFYYRLDKNFKANNVVLFEYKDEMIASRVVAVEGDTVNITNDGLEINGHQMYEPEIYSKTTQFKDGPTFPLTVEKDTVFVLGDNREKANDSRIIGLIHKKDIKGKVMGVVRRRNL